MTRTPRWFLLFLGCASLATARLAAQGALTPSGAPAPSMKSLDEIYSAVVASGTGGSTAATAPLTDGVNPRTLPLGPTPDLDIGSGAALFLTVNGVDIEGESPITTKGRENSIYVIGYGHDFSVPYDSASGLPTGRRQHKPFTIVKPIDKATPLLMKALAQNENVSGALRFYRRSPIGDGTTEQYYTVSFTNGRIVRVEQGMPGYEAVSFVYEKITWTYESGGVMH